ncbi:hypothetical protein A8924_4843 [Saccharopolyspora erythraea NRRL 2338]|nr:hypothetical protein N599_10840 [Saccharopolyspora erythraea D]PFG97407.1 hypothetical protein A8924_4843 [Saccharopolyspora erythraea NRRL 2338]
MNAAWPDRRMHRPPTDFGPAPTEPVSHLDDQEEPAP